LVFTRYCFHAAALVCALVAACLFIPGLGGGFIFDDRPNIQENGALHLTQLSVDSVLAAAYSYQPGRGTRALSMLSFALDHWRGGLDPKVFKTTNLVIHAVTTFALAFLFRRLLMLAQWPARRAMWTALALSGLWAIHPLQVSSVLYVVQRMQTLGTLFVVLALWAYLSAREAQIDGRQGRRYLALTGLFGVLAFAAKEDAVLLPAYALVLELTILRFRAAKPALSRTWRQGYLLATVAGIALYLFVVLPHYWSWGDYPGRTFSSAERLLTQGRVLVMHIGQILLPRPESMTFFYDDLQVSRGLLDPPSTLLALAMIAGLLVLAWRWRGQRPVFACGVLLFFAGHALTGNVLNLELAFEHRNHLPLIGAVLAIGDLFAALTQRWDVRSAWVAGIATLALLATSVVTVTRAHAWGDPLRFALYSVAIAPNSERAWLALGETYAGLGGQRAESPYMQKAIDACQAGMKHIDSPLLLSNIVTYKSIQGSVTPADWRRFHQRLKTAPMTLQNRNVVWGLIRNAQRGIPMDERGVLDTLEIVSGRTAFSTQENLQLASYAFSDTHSPDEALPYLERAVQHAGPDDPLVAETLSQLESAGHGDWVQRLRTMMRKED